MGALEQVTVSGVYMAQTGLGLQPVVMLEDARERLVPIYIGPAEAMAIDLGHRRETTPRPMTHDLIHNLLEAMGARVTQVVIDDLDDNVFYARLTVTIDGVQKEIDARPSDSIALAVRSGASIMMEGEVLDRVAVAKVDIKGVSEFSDFVE